MTKFTMLDLSTSHLTKGTLQKMDDGCEFDEVIYYPKWDDFHQGNIGYFIHINEEILGYDEEDLSELKRDGLPEDLLNIVLFAGKNGCDWINLDRDGDILAELPVLYDNAA